MKCSNKDATPKSKVRSTTSGDLCNCRPVFVSNEETALICWDPGGRRSAGWTPRHGSANRRQIKMRGMRSRIDDLCVWMRQAASDLLRSILAGFRKALWAACDQYRREERLSSLFGRGNNEPDLNVAPLSSLHRSYSRHIGTDLFTLLYLDEDHTTICLLLIHWRFLDIINRYIVWYPSHL